MFELFESKSVTAAAVLTVLALVGVVVLMVNSYRNRNKVRIIHKVVKANRDRKTFMVYTDHGDFDLTEANWSRIRENDVLFQQDFQKIIEEPLEVGA